MWMCCVLRGRWECVHFDQLSELVSLLQKPRQGDESIVSNSPSILLYCVCARYIFVYCRIVTSSTICGGSCYHSKYSLEICVFVFVLYGEKERERKKKVLRKWVRELDDSTVRSIRHMSPYLVVTWTCIFCYLMFAFWFNFTAIYHGNTLLWHFSQIFAEANVRVLSRVKGLFYVIRFMLAVGCIG